jgi:hypothetical protein
MYCFEGVRIRWAVRPDTSEYRDLAMTIAYGDTVEAPTREWNPDGPDGFAFGSPRLARQRPSRIGIRIAYTQEGVRKRVELDSALAWQSRVCNACSGSSSSCKDQMAHTALLILGSGTLP